MVFGPRGGHSPDCAGLRFVHRHFFGLLFRGRRGSSNVFVVDAGMCLRQRFYVQVFGAAGTYASKHLPDDVPEDVKVRRLNELIALQNELSAESNRRCEGRVYEVLVEGVSKRSKEQLFGRTEQNKVVVFDRGKHHVGDFVKVRVNGSSSATLKGEVVED